MKKHTEKYILSKLTSIAHSIIKGEIVGKNPNWQLNLSESTFGFYTKYLLKDISISVMRGYSEGELYQFVDDKETIFWNLVVKWRNPKPSNIWTEETDIRNFLNLYGLL